MMSSLLRTLLAGLHSHPVEIGSVSLLPVVYVVGSDVTNLPFFVWKSTLNPAAVKPSGNVATVFPDEDRVRHRSAPTPASARREILRPSPPETIPTVAWTSLSFPHVAGKRAANRVRALLSRMTSGGFGVSRSQGSRGAPMASRV